MSRYPIPEAEVTPKGSLRTCVDIFSLGSPENGVVRLALVASPHLCFSGDGYLPFMGAYARLLLSSHCLYRNIFWNSWFSSG